MEEEWVPNGGTLMRRRGRQLLRGLLKIQIGRNYSKVLRTFVFWACNYSRPSFRTNKCASGPDPVVHSETLVSLWIWIRSSFVSLKSRSQIIDAMAKNTWKTTNRHAIYKKSLLKEQTHLKNSHRLSIVAKRRVKFSIAISRLCKVQFSKLM